AVVKRATSAFPKMRFQSIAELREAFLGVIRPGGGVTKAVPGGSTAPRPGSGIRAAVGMEGASSGSGIRVAAVESAAMRSSASGFSTAVETPPPRNAGSTTPVTGMDASIESPAGPADAGLRTAVIAAPSPAMALAVPETAHSELPEVPSLAALLRDPRILWIAGILAFLAIALVFSMF
ncbi:MAG: hypothetical protein K8T20_20575, partial [Planctomycetes bacterium]|nr:hypothetical protein [Planctomycetota bacterium]